MASSTQELWVKNLRPTGTMLQTRYRTSKLTLARFVHEDEETVISGNADDAFVAVLVVGAMPHHEFQLDGRRQSMAMGPADAFNFADMRTNPTCRLFGPLEELHVHIPRAAFHDIADDADSPPIDRRAAMFAGPLRRRLRRKPAAPARP